MKSIKVKDHPEHFSIFYFQKEKFSKISFLLFIITMLFSCISTVDHCDDYH